METVDTRVARKFSARFRFERASSFRFHASMDAGMRPSTGPADALEGRRGAGCVGVVMQQLVRRYGATNLTHAGAADNPAPRCLTPLTGRRALVWNDRGRDDTVGKGDRHARERH